MDEGIVALNNKGTQKKFPGADDLLYGGEIGNWIKFAYTLKARYALRLTYAPGKTGAAQADIVLDALSKGFTSSADDADFHYYDKTDNENPWYQWGIKWNPVYVNTFMLNLMNNNADPRIRAYFNPTELNTTFVGHRNGTLIDPPGSVSIIVGTAINGNDLLNYITKSSSLSWATCTEAKFIEAEAYAWKSNFVQAKQALDSAIALNMTKIGLSNDTIAAFINRLGDMPNTFEDAQKLIEYEQGYDSDLPDIYHQYFTKPIRKN